MKFSKCLALMAAFVVGFGVLGTVEDGHATIQSVSITSPDSGATRGIDSVVVARITVQDFAPTDSLTLYVFLATDSATVIKDADAISTGLLNNQTMASTIRRANLQAGGSVSYVVDDFGADPTGNRDSSISLQKGVSFKMQINHFKIIIILQPREHLKQQEMTG